MISITNIICVINLVAIIVLFILFFTKIKESFTGAPSGYTNLIVSDPDGNLNTFSMANLETNINNLVDARISTEINNGGSISNKITETLSKYQPKGNYISYQDKVKLQTKAGMNGELLFYD